MTDGPTVRLFVWSDYVCPFCYLELPVIERLRDAYGGRVSIDWRAFELRPDPEPTLDPDGDYLHDIWGRAVYPMAEQRAMTLRLPPVQPHSRKAHEVAAFSRSVGRFEAMHETLFRAFFEDGFDIGDEAILTDLARSAGLDAQALGSALSGGRFTEVVLNDQRLARRMGLTGVPAIVVAPDESLGGQPLLVSGAQPYEVVAGAVEQVLAAGRKPS
ncbi:DsbA family oxidoreductase [Azospirillum picis]|uniref:DsbA family dithiol-disulfide isomerase n=1 Tax=Azospirillum picis TaxID=488438 RepID=A0ABU0MRK9_9PROT|nr:DsbA family oxidoreductase [Azospirillum picis]MBP2302375.1 putative DsbA family dithiol-disulfide isomerase [Azospirillum picis]MDQ0535954.1 putative DsbA family dithiol-disulfide isomerase [Azospirillum picis]